MKTIIYKTIFGSYLYGTNTEESDRDFKGIYIPPLSEVLLGKIKHSYKNTTKKHAGEGIKNTNKDIDDDFLSIQNFIQQGCIGKSMEVYDMLHTPSNMVIISHPIWEKIKENRQKFYTKKLSCFTKYIKKQAGKYGLKGSRINALKDVINIFQTVNTKDRDFSVISTGIWNDLPNTEFGYHIQYANNTIPQYSICGKIIQATATVNYCLEILYKIYENYGKRAINAAINFGIDWKAVSHAFRATIQAKELLIKNTITFPLSQADAKFLIDIKQGKYNYAKELESELDNRIDELKILSEKSKLPEEVNIKWWDEFLIEELTIYYYYIMKRKVF